MKKRLTLLTSVIVALAMFSSCSKNSGADSAAGGGMSLQDSNKAGTKGFYEDVFNAHNPAAVDKYCTTDFVDHNPDPGMTGKGSDELKKALINWFAAFPDIHVTVDKMVAEGDMFAAVCTFTGTMKGDMMGAKATNKPFKVTGVDVMKIKDGKATDRWGAFDAMGMVMQTGMQMPPPPAAPDAKKM